jgi:hypothetical protein
VNNVVYIAPNQGDAASIWQASLTDPNGFLYLLDAQTGALIKNITIPYVPNPFIAAGDPLALAGYGGNPAQRMTGQGIHAPVTVDSANNMAFVQQVTQRTFAVNLTSGAIMWTYDAYYNPGTTYQWGVHNNFGVLYAQGHCYFNEWYDIVCVNALTGNVTWTTYLSRESNAPLSYFAGTIYASSYFSYADVLNAATGAKESYAYCGPGATQPVPYAGRLYVASSDFNVTCFEEAVPPTIATTSITFELRPNSIVKGQTVIVAGSINGVHSAVPISVYFTKPDNSNPICINGTTDANGGFIIMYTPDMACNWTVVASWSGDATHLAGSSQSQTLTVVEPAQTTAPAVKTDIDAAINRLMPLFIGVMVAVIVAIILGAIAVASIRRLKK